MECKSGSDSTYGFKTHINAEEAGFIKAIDYTAGNAHDSNCFIDLLSGKESAAYEDSAYPRQPHNDWLYEHGVANRIIKRAYKNRPLTKRG